MKVGDLGEFGLINALQEIVDRNRVGINSKPNILIGIGDDAAAWESATSAQLGTTDTLVQGIHFDLNLTSWRDLGWKALAVNISDIAAMGGTPSLALISLGLPPAANVEQVKELYEGMAEIAGKFNMTIAGGDISESPFLTITPTVIGSVDRNKILTRSAAVVGDKIAVTGQLGGSAAGLKLLQEKHEFDSQTTSILRNAHLRPWARINEGQILANNGVKATIDISDGLMADLTHICQASDVGAQIYLPSIPINTALITAFPNEANELALTGGEDYELLFTAPEESIRNIERQLTTPVTIIGRIVSENPGKVSVFDDNGKEVDWHKGGWEHFGKHS